MSYSHYILAAGELPIAAAAILAIVRYRYLTQELRALSAFLFLSAIVHPVSMVLSLSRINNMPLLHAYIVLSTLALLWFYHQLLHRFLPRWLLVALGSGMIVLATVNVCRWQSVFEFSSITLTTQAVLFTILSLAVFTLLLDHRVRHEQTKLLPSLNWINTGIFIYFASNLLLFYFGEVLSQFTPVNFRLTWLFHSITSSIFYTCLFIGVWKQPKS